MINKHFTLVRAAKSQTATAELHGWERVG
jgi:hypothetical protein